MARAGSLTIPACSQMASRADGDGFLGMPGHVCGVPKEVDDIDLAWDVAHGPVDRFAERSHLARQPGIHQRNIVSLGVQIAGNAVTGAVFLVRPADDGNGAGTQEEIAQRVFIQRRQ